MSFLSSELRAKISSRRVDAVPVSRVGEMRLGLLSFATFLRRLRASNSAKSRVQPSSKVSVVITGVRSCRIDRSTDHCLKSGISCPDIGSVTK